MIRNVYTNDNPGKRSRFKYISTPIIRICIFISMISMPCMKLGTSNLIPVVIALSPLLHMFSKFCCFQVCIYNGRFGRLCTGRTANGLHTIHAWLLLHLGHINISLYCRSALNMYATEANRLQDVCIQLKY